jgi:hypothetical protein
MAGGEINDNLLIDTKSISCGEGLSTPSASAASLSAWRRRRALSKMCKRPTISRARQLRIASALE